MNLAIVVVDPILYNSTCSKSLCNFFLTASSRKACNSQSLESRNQNPTYGSPSGSYAVVLL